MNSLPPSDGDGGRAATGHLRPTEVQYSSSRFVAKESEPAPGTQVEVCPVNLRMESLREEGQGSGEVSPTLTHCSGFKCKGQVA